MLDKAPHALSQSAIARVVALGVQLFPPHFQSSLMGGSLSLVCLTFLCFVNKDNVSLLHDLEYSSTLILCIADECYLGTVDIHIS